MDSTFALPAAGALRTTLLLVAMEPSASRPRIESALVVLGLRAAAVTEALEAGWLVEGPGSRLALVDDRIGSVLARGTSDRERRTAHLALACAQARPRVGVDLRVAFDRAHRALAEERSEELPVTELLTTQEQRVADLAATGAANTEIARTCFISPKTVENHLTRVYRKLGVRSKAELAFAYRVG